MSRFLGSFAVGPPRHCFSPSMPSSRGGPTAWRRGAQSRLALFRCLLPAPALDQCKARQKGRRAGAALGMHPAENSDEDSHQQHRGVPFDEEDVPLQLLAIGHRIRRRRRASPDDSASRSGTGGTRRRSVGAAGIAVHGQRQPHHEPREFRGTGTRAPSRYILARDPGRLRLVAERLLSRQLGLERLVCRQHRDGLLRRLQGRRSPSDFGYDVGILQYYYPQEEEDQAINYDVTENLRCS